MFDELLYALSTLGEASFEKYCDVVDILYREWLPGEDENFNKYKYLRHSLIRLLESLGHCEYHSEKRKIFVCPPTLILLPAGGFPKAVLAGARSKPMVSRLAKYQRLKTNRIDLKEIPQKYGQIPFPNVVYIEATNKQYLIEAAREANIDTCLEVPAAWALVNFSAGIKEVEKDLFYEEKSEPYWAKRFFSPSDLSFKPFSGELEERVRLISYKDPRTQQHHHYLWEGKAATAIDREWGRYLYLAKRNIKIILYDYRMQRLAMPSTVPLPRLLARAATLCTGHVPLASQLNRNIVGISAEKPIDIYSGITPPLAKLISEKLSQDLIYCDLGLN